MQPVRNMSRSDPAVRLTEAISAAMIAILFLAGCTGQPDASVAASGNGDPTPSANVSPSIAASPVGASLSYANLRPGDTRIARCGDDGLLFSRDGAWVACGGAIYSWPAFEPTASFGGHPLGWGTMVGIDYVLIDDLAGGFQLISSTGDTVAIDFGAATGRTVASWSPDAREVWLQTGIQTPDLTLLGWTLAGWHQIASVPNPAGSFTNLAASPDGGWVAAWMSGCAASGGATSCDLRGAVGRSDGSTLQSIGPDIAGVTNGISIADDGSYYFAVQPGGPLVDLWTGPASAPASPLATAVRVWPVTSGSLAVADASGLRLLDVSIGSQEPLPLPDGIQPDKVQSVSPMADWVVALVGDDEETIRFEPLDRPGANIDVPRLTEIEPTVSWSPTEQFAVLREGPPATSTVVRLSN